MKKLLLAGIIAATLAGCATVKKVDPAPEKKPINHVTSVNMPIVRKCLDNVVNRINYSDNSSGLSDYWQSPEETDRIKKGDYDDRAIYLQNMLSEYAIDSKLVYGVRDYSKSDLHLMWLELKSNDTTYILNIKDGQIFYRSSLKDVKGNIDGSKEYMPCSHKDHLTNKLIDYYIWNKKSLSLANNIDSAKISQFLLEFPSSKYALIDDNKNNSDSVSMSLIKDKFNTSSKITYVDDSVSHPQGFILWPTNGGQISIYEYWQSPFETQKTLKGDCEDKAIHLQEELSFIKIYSQLVIGKQEKNDIYNHGWIEFTRRDTVYVADPTARKLLYRDNPDKGIVGNVGKNMYIMSSYGQLMDKMAQDYYSRNKIFLDIKNKRIHSGN